MIVATVLLMFAPIIKIGTGHLRELLFGGDSSGEPSAPGPLSKGLEWLAALLLDG